ncbi:RidA family protein [Chloroflexota bacterium]
MTKEIIIPANVHQARGYSHAIKVGNIIYVSGQVGIGEDNKVAAGGFEAQAKQALENLKRVLEASGAYFKDVVKLNTYVTTMEFIQVYRELRRNYFGDHYPASTLVQVAGLVLPEFLIEIEAVAVVE